MGSNAWSDSGGTAAEWYEPGVFEVVEGVFRIPLPLPDDALRAVNVYAIPHADGVTLVDSGWALEAGERALRGSLRVLGFRLEDISQFLVTHLHRDHLSMALALRASGRASISLGCHEETSLKLLIAEPRTRLAHLAALRTAGASHLAARLGDGSEGAEGEGAVAWAPPDRWLVDGEEISIGDRNLQVVHTPGHTRGHVVFRDEVNQVLFSGDHVLPHITPSIGYEPAPPASPLADFLNSLALLHDAPDALMLPAHGPAGGSVHERVDELLEHHALRLDHTMAAVEAGHAAAFDVARALTWTRRRRTLNDLDDMNAMLAIMETAAHMDVLVERKLLIRTIGDDSVARYSIPNGVVAAQPEQNRFRSDIVHGPCRSNERPGEL